MTSEVQQRIANLVEKARSAQRIFDGYNQAQVDEVVTAVGWAIINEKNNHLLTEMAIKDTGIGKYDDKIQKNYRKTLGLLRDLKGAKSVGVIAEYPELGLIEIARPVGVVGAVVPSTNPVATPFNKTLNALKGRNAIIIAPSPKGQQVCAKLVELIHAELTRVGAPTDLVQHLELPVNKAETYELMKQVDLMVATGSGNNVRACYESGTPSVGVGAGNVPVIVDDSANLADAAAKIRASKTFDNATSCSSENSLVILDAVYDDMIKALQGENAVLLNAEQKQQLQNRLWENGHLHRDVIAQTASRIAEITGFEGMADASILMVEETGIGSEFPYSDEKLSPVLTIYRAKDFDDAFDIVNRILDFKGKGHSVGIHTSNDEHIMRIGLDMPTCRVIVNQAHCFATGGSFDNGLPFSLSMGCGSWGGNSIADNMNYKHYLNTTRIARTIPKNEPTSEDIFGDFWNKFSIDAQALSRTYNTMNTVKSIIDNHAISQPDSIFLISPEIDYELSFAELKQSALELEKRFTALGIGRGEKVAFLMSNGLWSAKLFLGAMYSGRVIVPLNAVCGNDQLAYVIDHCDAEVIFVEDQIRQKYKTVFANIDSSIRVISTCRNNGPEWPDATPAAAKEHETGSITPDDEALLIYTSGTTGRPKGVLLTHKAVVAGGNNTAVAHQLTSEDRALCVLQLYHINGEMVTVMGPLVSGGSVVMPNKFSANEFWSLIDRWQCSWFSVVPTIIAYLLEQAERLGEPDYKASDRARLRFGRCASAPLAPDMHRQFEQQFAVPIIETMGLSETAAQILSNPMPPGKSKYGSPGIAFGNEAMIIDKQGNKQAPMESGELMIRGDNVLKEYYKNPEVTAETLRPDGWLHTGDLAYEDEDGYFFITGRLKEIIIKGGENIAPREIDEALYQHAAVLEAAAFPIPDRNYGQEILACVALKPGASCSAEELRALCIEKLGKFKAPKSISFMGELPKGPSGKIQRLKLAEAALKVS